MAAFNMNHPEFPTYDDILTSSLQLHNCRGVNGNIRKKLILATNNDGRTLKIDGDFGELAIVDKISCYYDQVNDRPGHLYSNSRSTMFYVNFEENIQSQLMIIRTPYNNTQHPRPVNYEALFLHQHNVVQVNVGRCNFKFFIEDPENVIATRNEHGRRVTTGRIRSNATLMRGRIEGPIVGPVLEVNIGNRLDIYKLKGIDIFDFIDPVTGAIPIHAFNPLNDSSWRRIINGEAREGFLLVHTDNDAQTGEPIYSNVPNNSVFVKICINDFNHVPGAPPPQPPTSTAQIIPQNNGESFRKEIETMGYIKNNQVDHPGHNRLITFDHVLSDSNNVYIIAPWKRGGDLFNKANTAFLNEAHVITILKRASLALSCLHEMGVSHNDVSMENIVSRVQNPLELFADNVCIIDFGQAILHAVDQQFVSYRAFGKFVYMPTECLDVAIGAQLISGFKIDVYQLGITCVFSLFPHFYNFCMSSRLQVSRLFIAPNLIGIGARLLQFRRSLSQQHLSDEALRYFNRYAPSDIRVDDVIFEFLKEVNRSCRPDLVVTDDFLRLLCRMLSPDPNCRYSMIEIFNILNGIQ